MEHDFPIKTILDTDIGGDVDDAAAVSMINIWGQQGIIEPLAIISCISSRWSAGAIDAINRYFDHSEIPVGINRRSRLLDQELAKTYTRYLTRHYSNRYKTVDAEDAVSVYRRVLAQQPDHSVQIVSIGMLTTVAQLLKSGPDLYSPLDGKKLVQQKVYRLVSMAGNFIPYYSEADWYTIDVEWNIDMDVLSAKYVAEHWPVDMVWSGFETGGGVMTGKQLIDTAPQDHPVRKAYRLFTNGVDRISCDLATLHYAVLGTPEYWELSPRGAVLLDEQGRTTLDTSSHKKNHQYLIKKVDDQVIKAEVDRVMNVLPLRYQKGGIEK